jgi:hypothetical protein
MKKTLLIIAAVIVVVAIAFGGYAYYKYQSHENIYEKKGVVLKDFSGLDHDIYVGSVSEICDTKKTGFDVTVGPTGWPVGSSLEWEVALYEDSQFYYTRLILHEYMLWWSWDDPYIVAKIPKAYVSGDPRNDEKYRWQMLWDITHAIGRTYNFNPYIRCAIIHKINGHVVSFGRYACRYEKYLVISDINHSW